MTAGQRLNGEKLADWHDKGAVPKLEAQPLLDAGNPVRWLRDRSLPQPALPMAYVEMLTGDRLRNGGRLSHRQGTAFFPLPPHLLVTPQQQLEPPRSRRPRRFVSRLPLSAASSGNAAAGKRINRARHSFATVARSLTAIRFGSGYVNLLIGTENRKIPGPPGRNPFAAGAVLACLFRRSRRSLLDQRIAPDAGGSGKRTGCDHFDGAICSANDGKPCGLQSVGPRHSARMESRRAVGSQQRHRLRRFFSPLKSPSAASLRDG